MAPHWADANGEAPHAWQPRSGGREAGELTPCRPGGHGPGLRDATPGLERGDSTTPALFRQIARAPGPAWAGCIDQDQGWGFGVPLAQDLIQVGVAGAQRAAAGDFSVVSLGHRGHRQGIIVDIPPDVECASMRHG
jgi:hypothetical protein